MVYDLCSALKRPSNGVYSTFQIHPSCICFPVARVWCTFPCIKWVDWISMTDRLRFGLRNIFRSAEYLSIIYKKMVCGHDLHRYPWEACSLDRSQHEHVCVDEPEVVISSWSYFLSLSLFWIVGEWEQGVKIPTDFLTHPCGFSVRAKQHVLVCSYYPECRQVMW